MILKIHDKNPQVRLIDQIVEILKKDGVIIYPTDTIYALGCSIHSTKAMDRICAIRQMKPVTARFSFICEDISQVAEYTNQIPNQHFKLMKRLTPGPYTFILNGSKKLPKMFVNKRHTVGARIQQTPIVADILARLGAPILSATLKSDDDITEYYTDPVEIHEQYAKLVDVVIDGGMGNITPSTVIDLTTDEASVVREGLGIERI